MLWGDSLCAFVRWPTSWLPFRSSVIAERAYHHRFDELDLLKQERLAGLDFIRQRVAVVGGTAFDDIGDVNVGARKTDGFEQLVEQAAGGAHKRLALAILVEPGGLT